MCPRQAGSAESPSIYRWSDELDEGVLITDSDGAVVWLNEYFQDMFAVGREAAIGLAPDEFVRRHLAEHLPDEAAVDRIRGLLCTGGQREIDLAVQTARGASRRFFVTSREMQHGPYRGKHLIRFRETARSDEVLREREATFRAIFEGAGIGVVLIDLAGRVIECNPRLLEMLGSRADELVGKHFTCYSCPDDLHPDVDLFRDLAAGRRDRYTVERRYVRSDGAILWGQRTVSLVRDGRGAPRFAVAMVEEITDRKQTEEALRESEMRFRSLFESSRDAIICADLEGCIVDANIAAERLLHYTCDELRSMTYQQLTPARWHAVEEEILESQIVPSGYSDLYEKEYVRKDGTVFPINIRVWLIADTGGRPAGYWAIFRDISDRKRAEEALRQRTWELEAARDEANLYLDIMTHDVRNANTASGMYADLLVELLEGEEQIYARKLRDAIRRSNEILANVATIRRIQDASDILLPMRLDPVIREEIGNFPGAAIRYGGADVRVLADGLLPMVFANLIGNAVKFGGPGVEVAVRVEEEDGLVRVSIEDTGPGVPDEVKEKLFQRFERGRAKGRGEGLGLFIARTLVERYGGTIRVDDRVAGRPEEGAAFRFTLRLPGHAPGSGE
ncbi:PAS domain S-box protein [Methanoculleus frigidifontis]|nr:PAS domain S-box protein [Methanoculleus sp. FWC-SCC1]